jgi:hypothetical protein
VVVLVAELAPEELEVEPVDDVELFGPVVEEDCCVDELVVD